MKAILFYHSLISDWNHGNAHFLRGVVSELNAQGHEAVVYEPADAWSVRNLVEEHGAGHIDEFHAKHPGLRSVRYDHTLDLAAALDGADVVIVHEWNDHDLVRRIGEHRALDRGYRLFFHDTHHRAVSAPEQMAGYDLSHYDGVLAYGNVLRDLYLKNGWTPRAWTWHEAADTSVFYPRPPVRLEGDLVWIGNWGDNERSAELREFLVDPVAELRLAARVYGVRYPAEARELLREAGIEYQGWLPNDEAPAAFAHFRVTVHVPRRPYVEALPGIPTIRPFEALACGIPLVCSPWNDAEGLFTAGQDYLVARDGSEMKKHLRALLADQQMAREIAEHGLATIRARHTCAHRVRELLAICEEVAA